MEQRTLIEYAISDSPSHPKPTTPITPDPALAETVDGSLDATPKLGESLASTIAASTRSTVLPAPMGSVARNGSASSQARFEVRKVLGQGGMGQVLLAYDHDIGRLVAIKKALGLGNDAAMLLRFTEEVRVSGQLEHPNIVSVHDVGMDDDGQPFFVMKYVQGETLDSVIEGLARGDAAYLKRFPIVRRCQIFVELGRAIEHAHKRGVVHRDLKPANVIIGTRGEVAVMDWGIARIEAANKSAQEDAQGTQTNGDSPSALSASDTPETPIRKRFDAMQTRVGALLGTPAYMSPEQARGATDQVDARSDVYSLSVLFHELLTLRHYLHDKQTLQDLLSAIMLFRWTYFSRIDEAAKTGVSKELIDVIAVGMSQDPNERFQTVGALLDALERVRDGEFAVRCAVTTARRGLFATLHAVDRHQSLTAFIVYALGLSALVGVVAAVRLLVNVLRV